VTSLLGVLAALAATRASRRARAAAAPAAVGAAPSSGTVAELMKTEVYSLSTEDSVLDALRMFTARGISGAPVRSADGALAGFLSDGDVMRYLSAEHPRSASIHTFALPESADLAEALDDLVELPVMRLATREVVTVGADASVAEAVALLADQHLKKVPVLAGDGQELVGIVSRSAVVRLALAGHLAKHREAASV
jgi:DHA2 family lincomycin resistance protein-like MFS transporter